MFGGKALGWMPGTLIWVPGVPGARHANVSSRLQANSNGGTGSYQRW